MRNSIEAVGEAGVIFSGEKAVAVYQATVIASGLRFYAKTGMCINRGYTPKRMMEVAAHLTGKKFKARDYAGAAAALKEYADRTATEIHAEGE